MTAPASLITCSPCTCASLQLIKHISLSTRLFQGSLISVFPSCTTIPWTLASLHNGGLSPNHIKHERILTSQIKCNLHNYKCVQLQKLIGITVTVDKHLLIKVWRSSLCSGGLIFISNFSTFQGLAELRHPYPVPAGPMQGPSHWLDLHCFGPGWV